MSEMQHARLLMEMVRYDKGCANLIQHLVKVHGFASAIGRLEGLDEQTQFILETAAILHDIGILASKQKYGSSQGNYQELEGPGEAEKLMQLIGGYTNTQIERVMYLVGHHHTYDNINGLDYQILVEADFLVNLYESSAKYELIHSIGETIFKTQTGKQMLADMFYTLHPDETTHAMGLV